MSGIPSLPIASIPAASRAISSREQELNSEFVLYCESPQGQLLWHELFAESLKHFPVPSLPPLGYSSAQNPIPSSSQNSTSRTFNSAEERGAYLITQMRRMWESARQQSTSSAQFSLFPSQQLHHPTQLQQVAIKSADTAATSHFETPTFSTPPPQPTSMRTQPQKRKSSSTISSTTPPASTSFRVPSFKTFSDGYISNFSRRVPYNEIVKPYVEFIFSSLSSKPSFQVILNLILGEVCKISPDLSQQCTNLVMNAYIKYPCDKKPGLPKPTTISPQITTTPTKNARLTHTQLKQIRVIKELYLGQEKAYLAALGSKDISFSRLKKLQENYENAKQFYLKIPEAERNQEEVDLPKRKDGGPKTSKAVFMETALITEERLQVIKEARLSFRRNPKNSATRKSYYDIPRIERIQEEIVSKLRVQNKDRPVTLEEIYTGNTLTLALRNCKSKYITAQESYKSEKKSNREKQIAISLKKLQNAERAKKKAQDEYDAFFPPKPKKAKKSKKKPLAKATTFSKTTKTKKQKRKKQERSPELQVSGTGIQKKIKNTDGHVKGMSEAHKFDVEPTQPKSVPFFATLPSSPAKPLSPPMTPTIPPPSPLSPIPSTPNPTPADPIATSPFATANGTLGLNFGGSLFSAFPPLSEPAPLSLPGSLEQPERQSDSTT